ncbi:uncharacterized protein LOC106181258 [Lingula anatina]|uniref:RNA-directed RNA polymerase n=1 Tax=Lingula anatina TaxID=7574 RepID=A0A2R2MRC5_LINAN|nr:uncharacterized protein LOC106181258 [Lingula anatina]|eukprot:XP_023932804.1 uncharacterized protein LOC106181258 [Lingula anatina]
MAQAPSSDQGQCEPSGCCFLDSWCSANGIKEKTKVALKDQDFDTPESLVLMEEADIELLAVTLGQRRVLSKALAELKMRHETVGLDAAQMVINYEGRPLTSNNHENTPEEISLMSNFSEEALEKSEQSLTEKQMVTPFFTENNESSTDKVPLDSQDMRASTPSTVTLAPDADNTGNLRVSPHSEEFEVIYSRESEEKAEGNKEICFLSDQFSDKNDKKNDIVPQPGAPNSFEAPKSPEASYPLQTSDLHEVCSLLQQKRRSCDPEEDAKPEAGAAGEAETDPKQDGFSNTPGGIIPDIESQQTTNEASIAFLENSEEDCVTEVPDLVRSSSTEIAGPDEVGNLSGNVTQQTLVTEDNLGRSEPVNETLISTNVENSVLVGKQITQDFACNADIRISPEPNTIPSPPTLASAAVQSSDFGGDINIENTPDVNAADKPRTESSSSATNVLFTPQDIFLNLEPFLRVQRFRPSRPNRPTVHRQEVRREGQQRTNTDQPLRDLSTGECLITIHNFSDNETRDVIGKALPGYAVNEVAQKADLGLLKTRKARSVQMKLNSQHQHEKYLEVQWCQGLKEFMVPLWLERKKKKSKKGWIEPKHVINGTTVRFGAFKSHNCFVDHCAESQIRVTFDHKEKNLQITKKLKSCSDDEFGFSESYQEICCSFRYSSLENYAIVDATPTEEGSDIYLFMKSKPTIQFEVEVMNYTQSVRLVDFASCKAQDLGASSALCVRYNMNDGNTDGILRRLENCGFTIYFTPVKRGKTRTLPLPLLNFPSFEVAYAYNCLLSRGYTVADRIDDIFLGRLSSVLDQPNLAMVLYHLTDIVDEERFETLDALLVRELQPGVAGDSQSNLPDQYVLIPRALALPTHLYFLQPEPVSLNRVVRKYGHERFLRLIIRDEDFEKLIQMEKGGLDVVLDAVMKNYLVEGLEVAGRHYKFLACSNSQLREHGIWMFAPDDVNTVESIREWMGDFKRERCVASYISRMGQCFSSSKDSKVKLTVEEGTVSDLPDIIHESRRTGTKYCFTDGIGKISEKLAKKVAEKLKFDPVPSAFQIRYAGCKGVLTVDPFLSEMEHMQIRPSMNKFDSLHSNLEIISTSRPVGLHLNRQVITLMSGLGVPDEVFLSLQEKMLYELADIMLKEADALNALISTSSGIRFNQLHGSGIMLTSEPFMRSMLSAVYTSQLGELVRRARIKVPSDKGRTMIGVVDEYEILKAGEVFVQYSQDVTEPGEEKCVLRGDVVITKNPCFHPGDMRKFRAVDDPQLHHLLDCVVFSSKGRRPAPNMMSGSDLDGDLYFVCWYMDLIPKGENVEPMEFPSVEKHKLDHDVTDSDMIVFISDYIKNDQLGIIANAHLAQADQEPKGIFSDVCKKLASLHSDAVDFPKTGKSVDMTRELRPKKYPDFMMNERKLTYWSEKVLGKLYRECRGVEQLDSKSETSKSAQINCDNDILVDGYDEYLEHAKEERDTYNDRVRSLMAIFGIKKEAQVVSGCITQLKKTSGFLKSERFEVANIIRDRMRLIRHETRNDFFAEFGGEKEALGKGEMRDLLCKKAAACYFATYELQDASDSETLLSFPWMFDDLLSQIKKKAVQGSASTQISIRSLPDKAQSPLMKVAQSIEDYFAKLSPVLHLQITQDRRIEKMILKSIYTADYRSRHGGPITIGSKATCLFTDTSSMDFFIPNFQGPLPQLVRNLCGQITRSRPDTSMPSLVSLRVPSGEKEVKVNFTSNPNALLRVAYFHCMLQENIWLLPILRVLLGWLITNNVVDTSGKILQAKEAMLLLFLYFVQDEEKVVVRPTEEDIRALQKMFRSERAVDPKDLLDYVANNYTAEEKIAELLLKFFKHFGSDSGVKLLNEVTDPSMICSRRPRKLLGNFNGHVKERIRDKMLQAYHIVARNASIGGLVDMSHVDEEKRLDYCLTAESSRLLLTGEDYFSIQISDSTGARALVHKKSKKKGSQITVEAYGNSESCFALQNALIDLERQASHRIEFTSSMKNWSVQDSHQLLLEGDNDVKNIIAFENFKGFTEFEEIPKEIKVPKLVEYVADGNTLDNQLKLWDNVVDTQVDLIKRIHNPFCHGIVHFSVDVGHIYVTDVPTKVKRIYDLQWYLKNLSGETGKKHSCFTPLVQTELALAVERKLRDTGFTAADPMAESYEVTFATKDANHKIFLDTNLAVINVELPDILWLVTDLKRLNTDDDPTLNKPDLRFQIASKRTLNAEECQYISDLKDIIRRDFKPLIRRQNDTEDTDNISTLDVSDSIRDRLVDVVESQEKTYRYTPTQSHNAGNQPLIRDMNVALLSSISVEIRKQRVFAKPENGRSSLEIWIPKAYRITVNCSADALIDGEEGLTKEDVRKDIWRFCLSLADPN